MEVLIRRETSGDITAIREVNQLAFGRPNEAEVVDKVRASEGYVPELSLVAETNTGIVGHALFSEAVIKGETKSWTVLALGPVAVSPNFQRQGIGCQMIETGIKRAADLGYGSLHWRTAI